MHTADRCSHVEVARETTQRTIRHRAKFPLPPRHRPGNRLAGCRDQRCGPRGSTPRLSCRHLSKFLTFAASRAVAWFVCYWRHCVFRARS